MITLITGVPGSGKSLYAVELLQGYLKENERLVEQGSSPREIFTNIDDLNFPGVQVSPDDWRDAPDGSVVVYDECQEMFGPDGSGRSGREDIQGLEKHRHRGMDLILITQHPKLLHAHVRRLIGRHHHLFRMYGGETAKVFTRDGTIDVDKPSALLKEDTKLWQYPKHLYGRYKSATVHTHKRHLPSWLKRSVIGLVAIVAITGVLLHFSWGFFTGQIHAEEEPEPYSHIGETRNTPEGGADTRATADPESEPKRLPRTACVWNDRQCICYDADGWRIEEPQDLCRDTASGPWERLPTSYRTGTSSTRPPSLRRDWSGSENAPQESADPPNLFRF